MNLNAVVVADPCAWLLANASTSRLCTYATTDESFIMWHDLFPMFSRVGTRTTQTSIGVPVEEVCRISELLTFTLIVLSPNQFGRWQFNCTSLFYASVSSATAVKMVICPKTPHQFGSPNSNSDSCCSELLECALACACR